MRFLRSIGCPLIAALLCTGCATGDNREASYYRTTRQRLESVAKESASAPDGKLSPGVAKVDITPPVGMP